MYSRVVDRVGSTPKRYDRPWNKFDTFVSDNIVRTNKLKDYLSRKDTWVRPRSVYVDMKIPTNVHTPNFSRVRDNFDELRYSDVSPLSAQRPKRLFNSIAGSANKRVKFDEIPIPARIPERSVRGVKSSGGAKLGDSPFLSPNAEFKLSDRYVLTPETSRLVDRFDKFVGNIFEKAGWILKNPLFKHLFQKKWPLVKDFLSFIASNSKLIRLRIGAPVIVKFAQFYRFLKRSLAYVGSLPVNLSFAQLRKVASFVGKHIDNHSAKYMLALEVVLAIPSIYYTAVNAKKNSQVVEGDTNVYVSYKNG